MNHAPREDICVPDLEVIPGRVEHAGAAADQAGVTHLHAEVAQPVHTCHKHVILGQPLTSDTTGTCMILVACLDLNFTNFETICPL